MSCRPELQALRRAVERDRYGLVAHVLVVRDSCQPSNCAAFQSLTDHNQVAANMQERIYRGASVALCVVVEHAGVNDGCRSARYAGARVGADGQADKCRVPDVCIHSAGQHHDARAAGGRRAVATAGSAFSDRAGSSEATAGSGKEAGSIQGCA